MEMMSCCASGVISSAAGSVYDLRGDVRIGSIAAASGINVTYCLQGPTGSRLAARSASIFSYNLHRRYFLHIRYIDHVNYARPITWPQAVEGP